MIRFNVKNLKNAFIFINIILFGIIYLFSNTAISEANNIIIITFLINGIIIIYNFTKTSTLGYSLNDMYNVFMLVFMVIAPFLQYLTNIFPWWDTYLITDNLLIYTNLIVFIFNSFYYLTYNYTNNNEIKNKKTHNFFVFNNNKAILSIGFYLSILASIYIIHTIGFANLFSRSTNKLDLGTTLNLIVGKSLRGLPLIVLLMNMFYKRINKSFYKNYQIVMLSFFTILLHFPTGLPRFQIAVVYLSIFIVYIVKLKNKYLFKFLIIFGLLFVFPFINFFRNNSYADFIKFKINLPNPVEDFLRGDFDAYSMLARSILYVSENSISFGKQLLGAIFFFIPRNFWLSKPVGSGVLVAESYGWSFTNVSMPFIGEAYINFGLLGVIAFSVGLAYGNKKLDNIYPIINEYSIKKINVFNILYPLLIGYLFFILRGDLLSSFAYTIGYSLPIFFILLVDKFLTNIKSYIG